jgi:AcrR family transcriptional regulator
VAKPLKSDKKAAIVEAATELFIQHGVTGTKMKQVAAKAGVDQPLIHYYFPDADALFMAVLDSASNHLFAASAAVAQAEADPIKMLKNYLIGTLEWPKKNLGLFSIWIYFYYLATFNPIFIKLNKQYREEARGRIALFIYKGLEKGVYHLPEGASVAEIAFAIHGMISGNTIVAATEGPVDWELFKVETLKTCFRMLGVESIS